MRLLRTTMMIVTLMTGSAIAAPSPIVNGPLNDWDLGHEPAIKGGATSIEEVSTHNGVRSKSRYLISLDAKGNYTQSKLVTEGNDRVYITGYKRDGNGNLGEVIQTVLEGDEKAVYSRQTGVYNAGKLTSIVSERRLTKKELQPEGVAEVETKDGTTTVMMKGPAGKARMTVVITYDKSGRLATMTMTRGSRTESLTVTRNDEGLVESATSSRGGTTGIAYQMDALGNWSKATITTIMKTPDGKERSIKKEIVRTISY